MRCIDELRHGACNSCNDTISPSAQPCWHAITVIPVSRIGVDDVGEMVEMVVPVSPRINS
ncbi:MAG: hypothetical protein CMO26_13845 [Thiotrichales bacterium]|nr:hypothetical protein [Thiotrichales bacterium]